MALTDSSDLFGSLHEDGLNDVIRHVMRKRPSLFNYGTQWVADAWRRRLCVPPVVAPEVLRKGNPVVTVEQPLPIIGSGGWYGLNFAAQLVDVRLDLHPSDIALPTELGGSLKEQQFALRAEVCAGIGCPADWALEEFPPAPQPPIVFPGAERKPGITVARPPSPPETIPLPTEKLDCFCLRLFATGHAVAEGPEGAELVALKVDGVEIVDVEPRELESNLECYIRMLLHYVVLPRLRVVLPVFVFRILDGLATITLRAEPGVPNNPAIEDQQLKLFVDVEVGA
jgi:hypothetical protein